MVGVAAIVAIAGGCATPSRRLPLQMVDDPVTLPARLLEVRGELRREVTEPRGAREDFFWPSFRYGLSDRITMDALTMFDFALLDDAPPAIAATGQAAAGAPLSLAVRAGAEALGWSSLEGFIIQPTVGVIAHKRVTPRLRLGGKALGGTRSSHGEMLSRGLEGWWLGGEGNLLFQLLEHTGFGLDLFHAWGLGGWDSPAHQREGQTGLTSRWFGARPGLSYRPFRFLTGGLEVEVRWVRWRPLTVVPMPGDPLPPAGDWSPPAAVRALTYVQLTW